MIEAAAVNLDLRIVAFDDGSTVPITNLFDEWGEDYEPSEAVSAVAGPLPNGEWLALDLTEFEGVLLQ